MGNQRPIVRRSKVRKAVVEEAEKEYRVVTGSDISDAVENDLREHDEIRLFSNENVDEDYLSLPADITEENSRELGKYFNAFTQQKMYVRTVIGKLSGIVREGNRELNEVRSDVFSSLPSKMSMKEKELMFSIDERAMEKLDGMFYYEEKLRMTSDYIDSLIDAIVLISREISRREGDWNDDKREDNIGKKKR